MGPTPENSSGFQNKENQDSNKSIFGQTNSIFGNISKGPTEEEKKEAEEEEKLR